MPGFSPPTPQSKFAFLKTAAASHGGGALFRRCYVSRRLDLHLQYLENAHYLIIFVLP